MILQKHLTSLPHRSILVTYQRAHATARKRYKVIKMTSYNPFISAIDVAVTELTSDAAKRYYTNKAQADIQTTVDAALTVGIGLYNLCSFIYALGASVGDAHYVAVTDYANSAQPEAPKALPASKSPLALLPAVSSAPRKVLVTPAPQDNEEVIITPAPKFAGFKSPLSRDRYMRLSKKTLLGECAKLGLSGRKSMTKSQLVDLILA
jgi:hypothetical protein